MNGMLKLSIHSILTCLIAAVWLANGLLCKVLNLAPRHEQIVASILGNTYSREWTVSIGIAEIMMTIWICSGYLKRVNAMIQIFIVLLMNVLEVLLVPQLLLWGYMNLVFAILFCVVIYYSQFVLVSSLKKK